MDLKKQQEGPEHTSPGVGAAVTRKELKASEMYLTRNFAREAPAKKVTLHGSGGNRSPEEERAALGYLLGAIGDWDGPESPPDDMPWIQWAINRIGELGAAIVIKLDESKDDGDAR